MAPLGLHLHASTTGPSFANTFGGIYRGKLGGYKENMSCRSVESNEHLSGKRKVRKIEQGSWSRLDSNLIVLSLDEKNTPAFGWTKAPAPVLDRLGAFPLDLAILRGKKVLYARRFSDYQCDGHPSSR